MAPQPAWWHDQTIVALARIAILNAVAVVGLLLAEQLAAHLIDGHTPTWGLVGNGCYAFGLAVTEVLCGAILVRASSPP